jgi:outer membrane biosynthesis protein TonB
MNVMNASGSSGFGGKLFVAALLALLGGYVWACLENGRNPLAVLSLLSSREPAPAPAAKPPAPKPSASAPAPASKPEPPRPEPVAAKPAVPAPLPAPTPKTYSPVEMNLLYSEIQDLLGRGDLFKAREKVLNTSRLMLPPDQVAAFGEVEARVARYHQLLLETTRGGTIAMPAMTRILIKEGGRLVVKPIREDADSIFYETLTGIRSRIQKSRCEEIKPLDALYARVEVNEELKKQAGYKNLVLDQAIGKPLSIQDKPGRTAATGLQIFDLADFAARNGANDKLLPLFDEALKRDPGLVATVHEAKADRMVDVLIYFLTISSTADAKKTLELLNDRYADTRAFRDRVSTDADVKTAIDALASRTREPLAVAAPAESAKPRPAEPAPAPAPAPSTAPATPAPAEPPPARPAPAASAEPNTHALPEGTSAKISDLVGKGDRYFAQAMEHLRLSDPTLNPDGWADENKKALDCFTKANQEGYLPAQDSYRVASTIPQVLLDRVRETTMRSSLCRKRSVSRR